MSIFHLKANYQPSGDQPHAISELVEGINDGLKEQILVGVTGSGKTFTIANVIKNFDRPVLVLSHNKTLASQLYSELKGFFPDNAVEYFVSYFDYYRPEAYIPTSDTYVEKVSATNQDIELLRMSTINSLMKRRDVIVVASVSSIYGALNPNEYQKNIFEIYVGLEYGMKKFLNKLVQIKYDRNDADNVSGTFLVKSDSVFITPADSENYLIRVDFFGDEIEGIYHVDKLTKNIIEKFKVYTIYPGEAYAVENSVFDKVIPLINSELEERIKHFQNEGKLLEAQRIRDRVINDMDDMKEYGFCNGIENYSMYLDGRNFGERPYTLFDYLPNDALIIIDESHMMIPQLNGMYKGDRSRKETLVEYGFRLPSALENRPLKFEEFEESFNHQKIYISATPGDYELDKTEGVITKLYVRPTGLLDPTIEIKPTENQIEDIYDQIQLQNSKNERTIILTTTKRMAEELSAYLLSKNIKAAYIHSEHTTFERNEILRKLRKGIFDVVVGINLLREGIDLPEVSLVVVLDADKESFMRNTRSLIQIVGRAARNVNGKVIFYADHISKSMEECIRDNNEKRSIQIAYNQKHNIIPQTIIKPIPEPIHGDDLENQVEKILTNEVNTKTKKGKESKEELIQKLREQMNQAAKELDYERAIELRDIILELQSKK
ncbi:excinuclease ABC subunit B [Mycoplasmopsis pullorum]|uniref:excinuclease ABC subunit UvrB n=1 Tax=Mycoplasmopsis pullorum TaxID=48003 RepID=UPI00111A0A2A|nr:excinuclease ABC subunit UvrB [Mycoplasmopsis pullorum]TNK82245.1 excinuclease ABC subunit B [Mycoplasmopsis pullorum]TNK83359.1 excinuclease ABC subunit B [Mycoplasmopsis pullorum]TNK84777.1 excinuclease ABC subunit B [Mycoplasmopsis pullorum]TNK85818.1 excinuclease ABC subunit B [Mycoplasmopsis pullorum]TNK86364.1 excinuclease ABC subunit B [Mycoplasmopsis pullorum]